MQDLGALGVGPSAVLALIAESLGLPAPRRLADLLASFDPGALPREPWVFPEIALHEGGIGQSAFPASIECDSGDAGEQYSRRVIIWADGEVTAIRAEWRGAVESRPSAATPGPTSGPGLHRPDGGAGHR